MTLGQFRHETAHLQDDTEVLILAPWGEIEPAAWVEKDDLCDDDPVKETFPTNALLITGEAS